MPSMTLKQAVVRLKNRLLLVQELYEQCYGRSRQTACLNSFISQTQPDALDAQMDQAQYNINMGVARPLEGIPIAFKDNFSTKGIATTCASAMLENYIPPYDATMVSRCLDNGALLIGKTNMDEFAMGAGSTDSFFGPVKNPWGFIKTEQQSQQSDGDSPIDSDNKLEDDWLISGGSSGGSAVAVATGSCLAAFGSDTGGSVRIPAAFCGVVGFKPTYGLLSRHGLIPLNNSFDVPGIFTQTVEDCAIVLDAVAGHDVKDSTTVPESHAPFHIDPDLDLSNVHIGIPKESYVPFLDQEVADLWRHTADTFEKAGARVSQVSLPHFEYAQSTYSILTACEVASNFCRYDGIEFGLRKGSEDSVEQLYAQTRLHGLNEVVRGRILAGNYFLLKRNYEQYYVKAQKARRLICEDYRKVFSSGVDLLLAPMTISDAPNYEWYMQDSNQSRCVMMDSCAAGANLAGLPSISVPLGYSKRGLPLGLQLIGPMFSETTMLSVADQMEMETDFKLLSLDVLDDAISSSSLQYGS